MRVRRDLGESWCAMFIPSLSSREVTVEPVELPAARAGVLATDISSRFGVRLRALRHERSITQLQVAVEFGIDRTFISDVERGKKAISLPFLDVIALGMKISLSDLLRDL